MKTVEEEKLEKKRRQNRESSLRCKTRIKEYSLKYYEANKETIKSRVREWINNNPEKIEAYKATSKERRLARYAENKDEINAKRKIYLDANREKTNAQRRARRAANAEVCRKKARDYYLSVKDHHIKVCKRWAEENKDKMATWREGNKPIKNAAAVKRRTENIEEYRDREAKYRRANRESIRNNAAKHALKSVAELRDPYVRQQLIKAGYDASDITPVAIELKRATMKFNRLIKDKQKQQQL